MHPRNLFSPGSFLGLCAEVESEIPFPAPFSAEYQCLFSFIPLLPGLFLFPHPEEQGPRLAPGRFSLFPVFKGSRLNLQRIAW